MGKRSSGARRLAAFWANVDKTDGCWVWTGAVNSEGYGVFRVDGRLYLAHRLSYGIERGHPGEDVVVDHRCHNPACVHPGHLRSGTHGQNAENRRGANANSKTGVRGVSPLKRGGFIVQVYSGGRRVHRSRHRTIEAAEAAAVAARLEHHTFNDADRV